MSSSRRSRFRPCIDLHDGKVKQIIGGTLSDQSAGDFAHLYRDNDLGGGHVIKLGPGNDVAARDALHLGQNAQEWLDAGASKVGPVLLLYPSHRHLYLFPDAKFSLERLKALSSKVGKDRLVVDVSCRKRGDVWLVAMNKWQDMTDMEVSQESLNMLSQYCSEFLIHAADVEGLCQGIDEALVSKLGEWVRIPCTYAGGAKALNDLDLVNRLSGGRIDLTYGSALDIFGGSLVVFEELVKLNRL
ncbi:hypothetical protein B0H10DRAFT_2048522 [Mycena sp. CBHHK59/15]|nr:hypothetical protein B0H10DRAFT_2048522 [Mycena sp. CBHHK59/15]